MPARTLFHGLVLAFGVCAVLVPAIAQEAPVPAPTVAGMVQEQVAKCWTPPVVKGTPAEGGLARIRVELQPDGSLVEMPRIIDKPSGPLGLTFAESAVRAVTRCAPYRLPPELYDNWKDIMLHFDTITF